MDEALLARVLAPYLDGCRYVRSASYFGAHPAGDHLAAVEARCAIGASCYIEETGHFNAVEANICFNQLFYLFAAQAVIRGDMDGLKGLTLEGWLPRQLPDVLILDYQFHFRRVIDRRSFRGSLAVEQTWAKSHLDFFQTSARFEDDAGGLALGRVRLAIAGRGRTPGSQA